MQTSLRQMKTLMCYRMDGSAPATLSIQYGIREIACHQRLVQAFFLKLNTQMKMLQKAVIVMHVEMNFSMLRSRNRACKDKYLPFTTFYRFHSLKVYFRWQFLPFRKG